jgi:hypothetical protein
MCCRCWGVCASFLNARLSVTVGRPAESPRGVSYPYIIPGRMYPAWMAASIIIASAGSYAGPISGGMSGGGCIDLTSLSVESRHPSDVR